MRILFIVSLLLHGSFHLPGFMKAFGIRQFAQLKQPISKAKGIGWLLAFFLMIASAFLFAFHKNFWWVATSFSAVISQVLIIYSWRDARFGTIMNLMVLLGTIIGFATWHYRDQYKEDVAWNFNQKEYFPGTALTEADIKPLPEAVKKYIRSSGCIGKPKVNNFRIEFRGKIRKNEESPWMPFSSEQYNFMKTPTRLFFMNARMKGLPVSGYHRFRNGNALMDIRLFSLIRVQYMEAHEMDTAETVTFFNDMCCMAPSTLIDPRIQWTERDSNRVTAAFTNQGIRIKADLWFNNQGELINFRSNDRYAADAGKKLPWATPLKNYILINGYRLAGYAETFYTYPQREFCYGTFELVSVQYNCRKED